jgi:hypothetical protein
MAKKLSDDNPCKECGARREARCICKMVASQASPKKVAAMARKRVKDRERYAKRMASEEPFPPRLCKSEACRLRGTVHPGKHERAVKLSDIRIDPAFNQRAKLETPWAEHLRERVMSVADLEALAIRRSETAEHCAKNRECMLLNGHSRPDCFTYADDAELARFRAKMPKSPSVFQDCGHEAYVKCLLPEGHEGPHQGNARFGAGAMAVEVTRRNRVN